MDRRDHPGAQQGTLRMSLDGPFDRQSREKPSRVLAKAEVLSLSQAAGADCMKASGAVI